MKKIFKQLFIVLYLFAAPLGVTAQTFVFHLAGGEKATVTLPATFTVTPTDDKLVIDDGNGNVVELAKDDVMCVTYRDAKGDMNGDQRVDVADVSTLVGLLIGKDVPAYLTCPDNHHPHMIDLGLPSGTKWACCNVGAFSPEEFGGYYAWGETKTKSVYDWDTYLYGRSADDVDDIGIDIARDGILDIAGTDYDVAHVKWGGSWVMPSITQMNELVNNTTSEWTTQGGVNGRKFIGSNGGSIFLPAAGAYRDATPGGAGSIGDYWTTISWKDSPGAQDLIFNSEGVSMSDYTRFLGKSVRPVR